MIETNDKLLLDEYYAMLENNELPGEQLTYTAQDTTTRDGRNTVWGAYVYHVEDKRIGKYVVELFQQSYNWTETKCVNFFDTEYEAKREALEWLYYKV